MVLGAGVWQEVVAAQSGWFFDPNLMFSVTLMFPMLFLGFTVQFTSSLSRSLPLPQLSPLLFKDLRRLQVYEVITLANRTDPSRKGSCRGVMLVNINGRAVRNTGRVLECWSVDDWL